jgi:hypothetical protein
MQKQKVEELEACDVNLLSEVATINGGELIVTDEEVALPL